jgi:hypothetical protein
MLAADLESRLEEWSRWARSWRRPRGHAGSIEGRYCSPQRNMWEAPVSGFQMQPLAWRAYQVEVVVTAMMNPWRECLRLHFVVRAQHETIRRVLRRGWRVNDHLRVLDEARRRVAVALGDSARPRSQVPSYPRLPEHV